MILDRGFFIASHMEEAKNVMANSVQGSSADILQDPDLSTADLAQEVHPNVFLFCVASSSGGKGCANLATRRNSVPKNKIKSKRGNQRRQSSLPSPSPSQR